MKKYFVTGLLIWIPLVITLMVLAWIVNTLDQILLIAPAAVHNLGIGLVPFKFARYYLINYGIIQLNTDFFIPKRQICLIRLRKIL